MNSITANELKVKGVSALANTLAQEDETLISVRGKPRFVIMGIGRYEQLRRVGMLSMPTRPLVFPTSYRRREREFIKRSPDLRERYPNLRLLAWQLRRERINRAPRP